MKISCVAAGVIVVALQFSALAEARVGAQISSAGGCVFSLKDTDSGAVNISGLLPISSPCMPLGGVKNAVAWAFKDIYIVAITNGEACSSAKRNDLVETAFMMIDVSVSKFFGQNAPNKFCMPESQTYLEGDHKVYYMHFVEYLSRKYPEFFDERNGSMGIDELGAGGRAVRIDISQWPPVILN